MTPEMERRWQQRSGHNLDQEDNNRKMSEQAEVYQNKVRDKNMKKRIKMGAI